MILVVGATGHLGTEISRRLTAQGRPVLALVRSTSAPEMVESLRKMGAQLVEGDLRDRASLKRAVAGADAIVSTATVTRSRQPGESIESTDNEGQAALVDAARDAKIKHLVYVSFSGGINGDDPLSAAKRGNEARLRSSGLPYTILRPSYFMESWLSPALGFDYINRRATIYGDGSGSISWISLGDVAEFAVRSLTTPAARNAALELGGPEALSPNEVVRLFEQESGDRFEVQHVPVPALESQQAAATNSLERTFASLMLSYARGNPISMDATLARVPVELTPVREYARQVLAKPS